MTTDGLVEVRVSAPDAETEQEHLLLLTTTAAGFGALRAHVAAAHPHETPRSSPCRLPRPTRGYAAWVRECVGG